MSNAIPAGSYVKDKEDLLVNILYEALLLVSDKGHDSLHCEKYNVKYIVEGIVKGDLTTPALYKSTKHIFNKLYAKLLADGF
mgnify:CR=1 FL=1|tara:strand:- start:340 stop:585 length:246 start_codon:yes stop_codon:yes gene_type:complete